MVKNYVLEITFDDDATEEKVEIALLAIETLMAATGMAFTIEKRTEEIDEDCDG